MGEFINSYKDLTSEEMQIPRVVGEWSVKDIISHVTSWEQECLFFLPLILRGERFPGYKKVYCGIDKFNALKVQNKNSLTLDEILVDQNKIHNKLLTYLDGLDEEIFLQNRRFTRRLGMDTAWHYPEHTASILTWRKSVSL